MGRSPSSAFFSLASSGFGRFSVGVSASDDTQESEKAKNHFDPQGQFNSQHVLPLHSFLSQSSVSVK